MLTFDLDFAEIVAITENVILRLDAVLAGSTDALARGAVVVVEDSRHRVRRLPVGSA